MKTFAKQAVLLVVSVLAALGLAEIIVRMAASVWFDVKYLATAGVANMPRAYASLEDFLGEYRVYLVPHRPWYHYYTNSLGFMDREFSVKKVPGTRRIMALGDSFAYGSVEYPQNVLTLVEDALRRDCRDGDTKILNFGIPATGVWEYRLVHKLAAPRYKPDVVIIHFYMGNDGPDLIHGVTDVPSIGRSIFASSYAWNYVANSFKLLRSLNHPSTRVQAIAAPRMTADRVPQGGDRISDGLDLTDRDFQPTFTEEAFSSIAAAELGRFYRGKNMLFGELWKTTLGVLDALTAEVIASTGRGPLIILYPSQLQVYPQIFEVTKRQVENGIAAIDHAEFDSAFPGSVVLDYCRRAGLSCYDVTPAFVKAARESPEPLYKPRDGHWNIRGNRVAATAEAEFLGQELCRADER